MRLHYRPGRSSGRRETAERGRLIKDGVANYDMSICSLETVAAKQITG